MVFISYALRAWQRKSWENLENSKALVSQSALESLQIQPAFGLQWVEDLPSLDCLLRVHFHVVNQSSLQLLLPSGDKLASRYSKTGSGQVPLMVGFVAALHSLSATCCVDSLHIAYAPTNTT